MVSLLSANLPHAITVSATSTASTPSDFSTGFSDRAVA
jgi:hypothetical protein